MAKQKTARKGETTPLVINEVAREVSQMIDAAVDGTFIVTFSKDGGINFRAVNCGLDRIAIAQAIAGKCAADRLAAATMPTDGTPDFGGH